jgi:F0F1-type ATP synthase assembly protein I
VTNLRKTWESFLKAEVVLVVLMWKFVEFSLVCLKLLDEVDKMAWLLEFLEILCVNYITEFVFNTNNKFN